MTLPPKIQEPQGPQIVVRPFSRRGFYPNYDLHFGDYFFGEINGQLIGVAPKLPIPGGDEFYSEFDLFSPGEIALMTALTLSVPEDMGAVRVYPMPISAVLTDCPTDLAHTSPDFVSSCARICEEAEIHERIIGEREYAKREADQYQFHDFAEVELANSVLAEFPTGSALLLRGAHALIKAEMLLSHSQFNEEAALSAYIALEASYQLISQKVQSQSSGKIKPINIADYLRKNYDERWADEGYFSEFYMDRVAVVHPVSRYGVFPYAPISHCDFLTLLDYLVPMYRWIILSRQYEPD